MRCNLAIILIGLAVAGCTITTTSVVPGSGESASIKQRQGTLNPVISSLTASPTALSRAGQTISVQVSAYDPRGENLRYTWSATGGVLSTTTGTLVSWKAPGSSGTYTIQVLVSNDSGGTAAGTLNIQVNEDGTGTVSEPTFPKNETTNSDSAAAQTLEWSVISPGMRFKDCHFVSFSSGWVVGDGGVRHTSNAGATWIDQTTPTMRSIGGLNAVYFLPSSGGSLGWVASADKIHRTSNGGTNWSTSALGPTFYSGSGPFIQGIYFQDALHGAVVASGNASGLYLTDDGGVTWAKSADGSYVNVVGISDGTMFVTPYPSMYQDYHLTSRFKAGGLSDVYSKTFQFISGEPGVPGNVLASHWWNLYGSHDGGLSWEEVPTASPIDRWDDLYWRGVAMLEGGTAFGLKADYQGYQQGDGTYYAVESLDGGNSWQLVAKLEAGSTLGEDPTMPRFFAFDRRHAWQAFIDDSKLLRIGAP